MSEDEGLFKTDEPRVLTVEEPVGHMMNVLMVQAAAAIDLQFGEGTAKANVVAVMAYAHGSMLKHVVDRFGKYIDRVTFLHLEPWDESKHGPRHGPGRPDEPEEVEAVYD